MNRFALGLLACAAACKAPKNASDTSTRPAHDSPDSGITAQDSALPSDSGVDSGDTGDSPPVFVPDISVDCTGAADYTAIQAAIDAAVSGDVIGVAPCVYHERLDYLGKSLEIYGTDGSATTIVDADLLGPVLSVVSGESDGTSLSGFTLQDGVSADAGAGITVIESELGLNDVVLTGSGESYAIIDAETGFLDLTDVTIVDNTIAAGGSAIRSSSGSLTARRLIADCGGGSYALYEHNATLIDESVLTCSGGYGFYSHHGELNVLRSTLTGGIAALYSEDEQDNPSEQTLITNSALGGGLVGVDARYVHVELRNDVLWGTDAAFSYLAIDTASSVSDTALLDAACGISGDSGTLSITWSAFFGNAADTCGAYATPTVTTDPRFTSFPDDLTLQSGSPWINAGDPSAAADDGDGTRDDIGRWGGPFASL